jgi:hypothetical protein
MIAHQWRASVAFIASRSGHGDKDPAPNGVSAAIVFSHAGGLLVPPSGFDNASVCLPLSSAAVEFCRFAAPPGQDMSEKPGSQVASPGFWE